MGGIVFSQVVINEVLYDPSGTDTGLEWIELKNIGATTMSLTNYCLYASGEHYIFPTFSLNAGAFVIIHWNATGTDNTTDLYTGTASWSNMGNTSGSVALFNTHTPHSSSTIVDFVEYGSGSQTWESTAVSAGIWTTNDYVADVVAGHSIEYDGSGEASSDWFDQATPTQGSDNSLPVELSSFTIEHVPSGVLLKWRTESEIENLGFFIDRKTNNSDWEEIVSYKSDNALLGQGTVSFATDYEYTDRFIEQGKTYEYRLADVDYNNVVTYHATRSIHIDSNSLQSTANDFIVSAYPNPFNPTLTIRYSVHSNATDNNALVQVDIYNISGEFIKNIINTEQPAGWHEVQWNGSDLNGNKVAGGTYIYRVKIGNTVKSNKIIFLQ